MRLPAPAIIGQFSTFATLILATTFSPVAADEGCPKHYISRWYQNSDWPQDYEGYFTPINKQKWEDDGLWYRSTSEDSIAVKICNGLTGTSVYKGPILPPCCSADVSRTDPREGVSFIPDQGYYVIRQHQECDCEPVVHGDCNSESSPQVAMAAVMGVGASWERMFMGMDIPLWVQYFVQGTNLEYVTRERRTIQMVNNMDSMFQGAHLHAINHLREFTNASGEYVVSEVVRHTTFRFWRIDTRITSVNNMFYGATGIDLEHCPCIVELDPTPNCPLTPFGYQCTRQKQRCPGLPDLGERDCVDLDDVMAQELDWETSPQYLAARGVDTSNCPAESNECSATNPCANGLCCSHDGYCGFTFDYCGHCCQSGNCLYEYQGGVSDLPLYSNHWGEAYGPGHSRS